LGKCAAQQACDQGEILRTSEGSRSDLFLQVGAPLPLATTIYRTQPMARCSKPRSQIALVVGEPVAGFIGDQNFVWHVHSMEG